jgi:hypothetical protein
MTNRKIFIPAEFIDSDDLNYIFITILVATIFFIYINQFFIEIKDIIILTILIIFIFKYLK